MMKMLDLFSGIGGFSLAAQWTGQIETVQFVEIDPFCQKVLQKNFKGVPIHDDIKTYKGSPGTADIICGGFPCQPFSIAGKRKGKDDDRFLWPEMLRVISEVRPTWVVGENVAGIINMALKQVVSDLASIDYECQPVCIPVAALGGWHRRDRIWFLAHLQGLDVSDGTKKENNREFQGCNEYRGCFEPSWFDAASQLCRKDDGVSSELDKHRLKSLGNAIVPQVAYQIFKAILNTEVNQNA
jgi:DNA (cytosine-5)-methyltransferase 1